MRIISQKSKPNLSYNKLWKDKKIAKKEKKKEHWMVMWKREMVMMTLKMSYWLNLATILLYIKKWMMECNM